MKNMLTSIVLCLTVVVPAFSQSKVDKRLSESTAVLKTIITKNEIPKAVLEKAICVMVYPAVRKVGVGLGVTYGRGVIVCRTEADMVGKWGAPAMYSLDTRSLGAQLGSSSTDYVLLVMSQRGASRAVWRSFVNVATPHHLAPARLWCFGDAADHVRCSSRS